MKTQGRTENTRRIDGVNYSKYCVFWALRHVGLRVFFSHFVLSFLLLFLLLPFVDTVHTTLECHPLLSLSSSSQSQVKPFLLPIKIIKTTYFLYQITIKKINQTLANLSLNLFSRTLNPWSTNPTQATTDTCGQIPHFVLHRKFLG